MYATWNLSMSNDETHYTSPSATIAEDGFNLTPIIDISTDSNIKILGQCSGYVRDLSEWNFTEISKEEAISIFSTFFVEIPEDLDRNIKALTLSQAIENIFNID